MLDRTEGTTYQDVAENNVWRSVTPRATCLRFYGPSTPPNGETSMNGDAIGSQPRSVHAIHTTRVSGPEVRESRVAAMIRNAMRITPATTAPAIASAAVGSASALAGVTNVTATTTRTNSASVRNEIE